MTMKRRPVALIIRDGWGINPRPEGNAVFQARTPSIDRYLARYPWSRLACSGEAVGLPEGYALLPGEDAVKYVTITQSAATPSSLTFIYRKSEAATATPPPRRARLGMSCSSTPGPA